MGKALASLDMGTELADDIFLELEALRDRAVAGGLSQIAAEIQKVLAGSLNGHIRELFRQCEARS